MTENLYTPDCIRTFTGKYVNVFDPKPEMIDIVDIAHSLSRQCRFAGHLPAFYSVAEHSIMASIMADDEFKMQALLHDASEAYLLDIPKPIKLKMPEYQKIEEKLMCVIAEKFGFAWPMSKHIESIDKELLHMEWDQFVLKTGKEKILRCWEMDVAKEMFIGEFKKLKQ